eukprot:GILJ01004475.1.p1 GENE.GILJ01004475.1~~GILJ01004475.1.p1  ORF type:complete len:341 (+),score=51.32 GILJ01004475.1:44-1024(+)
MAAREHEVPFNPDFSRYDPTTVYGRARNFYDIFSPMNLLASDKDLLAARNTLEEFKAGRLDGQLTQRELWRLNNLVQSSFHPDTGELIPRMFRMSAFVPINIPIALGMITSAPTLTNIIFWQWVNQTYNSAVNYANRNASTSMSDTQRTVSYLAASITSVAVAVGLNRVSDNARFKSQLLKTAMKTVAPYTAVASAGALNVLLMRYSEATQGVDVRNSDGSLVGRSAAAGVKALSEVTLTRVALPVPVLLFPPIILGALTALHPPFAVRSLARTVTELTVIAGCLRFALPAAIGLFPQTGSIASSSLEPELRSLAKGPKVFYNKGL